MYGSNPSKRKFIREARDCWFEICETRYCSDDRVLSEIRDIAKQAASKQDLELLKTELFKTLIPEMQKFGYLMSNDEAIQTQKNSEYSSLDDIICFLYKMDCREAGVREKDVAFLFEFVFGDDLGDEGIEQLKKEFTFRFGVESAKKLCAYILFESPTNFYEGFTESEMSLLTEQLRILMVAMLRHQDLVQDGPIILTKICDDMHLRLWAGPVKDKTGTDSDT